MAKVTVGSMRIAGLRPWTPSLNDHGSARRLDTGQRKQGYEAQILKLNNERLQ